MANFLSNAVHTVEGLFKPSSSNTPYNPAASAQQALTPRPGSLLASQKAGILSSAPKQNMSYNTANGQAPSSTNPLNSTAAPAPKKTTTTVTEYHPPAGTTPGMVGTPQPNANGLSDSQVSQGYSTIPGLYDPVSGQLKSSETPPPSTTPTATGNPQDAAQAVYNSGQQTQNEQTQQQNVLNAGKQTPDEQYYNNMAIQAKGLQNVNTLSPYSEAQFYGGNGQQLAPDEAAPDLAGRAAGTNGLAGSLGNIFGSAAQQGYANALQQQQLQLGSAENAYGGAQTQAGRGTTASADVLSNTIPQQVSPTNVPYNPITGQYGNPAANAYGGNGLAGVGALQQQQQQGADIQTMSSAINQTSGLIAKTKQDIASNPQFNIAPIPLANALQSWLSTNVVSSPQYQNIINDLSEVANTIAPVLGVPGNPTNLKTIIANELVPKLLQGQDIGTVLDNLEANANVKLNAAKQSASTNAVNNSSPQGNSLYDF